MRIRALAAAGLALAALAAGCGGDSEGSPIPAEQASDLQQQLDSVAERIRQGSAGACLDAIQESPRGDNVSNVEEIIDSLPGDVDEDVRDALLTSFDRLFELVSQRCDELDQVETDTPDTTGTTDTVETTPPDTTPTDTQPQTTPTTPTTPDVPTTPTNPDPDGGSGSGGAGAPGEDGL